jgi:flagellar biosynthesis component FlhA
MMREKFRQFMAGRYGTDALNQFLNIAAIVLLLLALITRVGLFSTLALIALVLCYYRTFSRNIAKRTEENYKFYTAKERAAARFATYKDMWANRKQYRYYRCPKCHQKLRVPRGRGRIQISCPRCGDQFVKKS